MAPLIVAVVSAVAPAQHVVLPAADCPALFGYPEDRARIAAEVADEVILIERSAHRVTIVTHAHWRDPEDLTVEGVELVGTPGTREGRRMAVFVVEPEAGVDCPAARYVATAGRTVGRAEIVAILDRLVLLEVDEELYYMALRGGLPEVFTVTWQSEFALETGTQTATPGATPGATARATPTPTPTPTPVPRANSRRR